MAGSTRRWPAFRRCSKGVRAIRANANGEVSMAEPNPTTVIADCIEKSKASTDPELISDYIAEALGVLQTNSTEDDAFNMAAAP